MVGINCWGHCLTLVAFREHFRLELVTHGSASALLDAESIHLSINQGLESGICSDKLSSSNAIDLSLG
jgi:hypothetical protein